MEKSIYIELEEQQNKHWWCLGRKAIILDMIDNYANKPIENIMDIGCGTGAMLQELKKYGTVVGVDCNDEAIEYCTKTSGCTIYNGYLPYNIPNDKKYDIITCLDVLEHVDDDTSSLKSLYNLLNDDGTLVVTVPALMCMWGIPDALCHHKRRYTKKDLVEKINLAGFKIEKCSYYNCLLFPPAFIVRKLSNLFKVKKSNLSLNVGFLNNILEWIFASERFFLRKVNFSYGVSLVAVLKKK